MPELQFVTAFGTIGYQLSFDRKDIADPTELTKIQDIILEGLKHCCALEAREAKDKGLTLSNVIEETPSKQ